jgi:hypothetical protein
MFKLHARHASASEAGDYLQVLFEEKDQREDGRYLLVQRQFEFPDGGRCAIETELPEMCGHFRIRSAVLERARFQISWFGRLECQAEVTFDTDDESYADIRRIMATMIPELEVRLDEKMC